MIEIVFKGVVKFYHSGSGEALRWGAQRYDIGRDEGGGMRILNQELSLAYASRQDAEQAFGPERDCPPKEMRKWFPWMPKEKGYVVGKSQRKTAARGHVHGQDVDVD